VDDETSFTYCTYLYLINRSSPNTVAGQVIVTKKTTLSVLL
jgi:hypothetical protein